MNTIMPEVIHDALLSRTTCETHDEAIYINVLYCGLETLEDKAKLMVYF
jgi:hypothetical protein